MSTAEVSKVQSQSSKLEQTTPSERLQQLKAQVDVVVNIMRTNMKRILEKDKRLSDRADTLQQKVPQFEQQTGQLPKISTPVCSTPAQQMTTSNWLQHLQTQVDDVVNIMRTNVKKILDREEKFSEMVYRADASQQEVPQFEQQTGQLPKISTPVCSAPAQQMTTFNWIQQLQAKVENAVDIILTNVKEQLDRDQKLSEMADLEDALQQRASRFENHAGELMSTVEGNIVLTQQMTASTWLQQIQAQVNDVVDIMHTNIKKLLERDKKLSEMAERVDALQQCSKFF